MSTANLEPDQDRNQKPQLWETEVEDILQRTNLEPTSIDKARSSVTAARYQIPNRTQNVLDKGRRFSPISLLMITILLLTVGSFVIGHFIPLLGRLMAFGALIAVAAVIVLVFTGRAGGSPSGPSWRQTKVSTDDDDRPTWRRR